ncbi:MAG: hypothetical protein ACLP2Q_17890 [Steroidobacteraceae bacterium]|jgi:hypothetical protein
MDPNSNGIALFAENLCRPEQRGTIIEQGGVIMQDSRPFLLVFLSLSACLSGLAWSAGEGPSATTAKVSITSKGKELPLQRNEQIALMFMPAISSLEDDCLQYASRGCSMDELVNGGVKATDQWKIGRLKFDPRTTDPKKPGLGGFYFVKVGFWVREGVLQSDRRGIDHIDQDGRLQHRGRHFRCSLRRGFPV